MPSTRVLGVGSVVQASQPREMSFHSASRPSKPRWASRNSTRSSGVPRPLTLKKSSNWRMRLVRSSADSPLIPMHWLTISV
jgi:hypothetical protein